MPNDHHARAVPLPGTTTTRDTATAATELSLTDEELLDRYPAVRGVAERWIALRRESGTRG
ncbi:hypothetical protein ACGF5F_14805 [Streptomyces sp. NPDC047821]|uniref:hypothetical protein n=1 Tax=unclassified Streptomyces TaxID=2593676 RepID=UPI0036318144